MKKNMFTGITMPVYLEVILYSFDALNSKRNFWLAAQISKVYNCCEILLCKIQESNKKTLTLAKKVRVVRL